MKKKIVKIRPYFQPRIWGGSRMLERYGYETDVRPVGEVYNVVALPGAADCHIEGEDMTLSELYAREPGWFDCETEQLPIRVNILDPLADLSVQLHPDDAYALAHDGSRGKPECWVILDTPEDGKIECGHHARTREEFVEMATRHDWGRLLRYLPAKRGWFIDLPAGTLHAIGRDVLTYNVSRSADQTIEAAIKLAHDSGAKVLADMCNVRDLSRRAREVSRLGPDALGPDYLCCHVGYDRQATGADPVRELKALDVVDTPKAIAGGIKLSNFAQALASSAEIVICGGAICNAPDPAAVALRMRELIDSADIIDVAGSSDLGGAKAERP